MTNRGRIIAVHPKLHQLIKRRVCRDQKERKLRKKYNPQELCFEDFYSATKYIAEVLARNGF